VPVQVFPPGSYLLSISAPQRLGASFAILSHLPDTVSFPDTVSLVVPAQAGSTLHFKSRGIDSSAGTLWRLHVLTKKCRMLPG